MLTAVQTPALQLQPSWTQPVHTPLPVEPPHHLRHPAREVHSHQPFHHRPLPLALDPVHLEQMAPIVPAYIAVVIVYLYGRRGRAPVLLPKPCICTAALIVYLRRRRDRMPAPSPWSCTCLAVIAHLPRRFSRVPAPPP